MKVERSVFVRGLAFDLTIASRDGTTHSAMNDIPEPFQRGIDLLADELVRSLDGAKHGPRISLAVEAPACLLPHLREETDLDFPIAHRVLEDEEYRRYYSDRGPRECILDNGLHELGEAIPLDELLRAAKLVKADYVIAPDRIGDSAWTADQFSRLQAAKHDQQLPFKLAVVLTGNSARTRRELLQTACFADMLCLPYDQPRLLWYQELFPYWRRVHLLGVSELSELQAWLSYAPFLHLSVDTGKPVKYGLLERNLRTLDSLRHSTLLSHKLLEISQVTPSQLDLVKANIRFMKSLLR